MQAPWTNVFSGRARTSLEDRIIGYIQTQRWFGGKGRAIKNVAFLETVPVSFDSVKACITQIQVEYTIEEPETYVLPLAFASAEQADEIRKSSPAAIIAEVTVRDKNQSTQGIIYDAVLDKGFCRSLIDMIARRRQPSRSSGASVATTMMIEPSPSEGTGCRVSGAPGTR